jgi:succinate dehydrogenase / fumarate reductase cytochrome b subunit
MVAVSIFKPEYPQHPVMNKPVRPLSPHLQVYRLPLTAWLSIIHRMTGVLLVIGMVLFTTALLVLANNPTEWQIISQLSAFSLTPFILLLFCFSFWLHWAHGLRHLIWDTGRGFNLQNARLLDGLEITVAVLLTVSLWIVHGL